ncbi:MAG: MFS transporter [Halobacteriaceae archaeon]
MTSTPTPTFRTHLAARDWEPLAGYAFFVVTLAAGYYYNLTFVQLGLVDLGTRLVGLSRTSVSVGMAGLALCTFLAAVVAGVAMDRRDVALPGRLRALFAVLVAQTALTVAAPHVRTAGGFAAWLVACSVALGVGIPVTFGLTTDLIAVPDRGHVAAAVTALAFFAAAVYPMDWRVEAFSRVLVVAMVPAVAALGAALRWLPGTVETLADRAETVGPGRFCRPDPVGTWSLRFWLPVVLMFGAFFVDSLGFLRITATPVYVLTSWQSPDVGVHLFIGAVHVAGALAAGVLYVNFGRRWLFLWVFGLFAFTHLLYSYDAWALPGSRPPLLMPMFYSVAVSFYTTLNFALWPDLSTSDTAGTHTALGVGLAGWVATFLSTAVALYFEDAGVTLLSHLRVVDAMAFLLLFLLAALLYVRRALAVARGGAKT